MSLWEFQISLMSHNLEIKEGAFLVSDAHCSHVRGEFLNFLKEIHLKKLRPSQLIFLGDMFDALFGGVVYTQKANQETIKLLNKISLDIELIYFEGNHDFNLKKIFPHAKIFSISQQPLTCKYRDKKIILSHGDFLSEESELKYKIYTTLIRNPIVLWILSGIDLVVKHMILKKLDNYLSKKDDCKELANFEEFILKRLDNKYSCDYFIEGHFHQNKEINLKNLKYINLGAFACNQRYFVVKSSEELELLEENIFSKEK